MSVCVCFFYTAQLANLLQLKSLWQFPSFSRLFFSIFFYIISFLTIISVEVVATIYFILYSFQLCGAFIVFVDVFLYYYFCMYRYWMDEQLITSWKNPSYKIILILETKTKTKQSIYNQHIRVSIQNNRTTV